MQEYRIINEKDNVAVALTDLKAGTVIKIKDKEIVVKEDIMRGHKVALCDIPAGTDVIKYGDPIGHTTENVAKGCHIHTQNIKTNLGQLPKLTL